MKSILVTGAGGFAGRIIAEYLYKQGYDVLGTVRKKVPNVDFPIIKCDLSKPIMIEKAFDVIVHSAGRLPYGCCDYLEFKIDNIDTMDNLLKYAKKMKVKRFIYLSTIGVYGEFREASVDENSDRINPDAYGQTKYIAECMLRNVSDLEGICLRMPGIIGPGCHGGWFSNVMEKFIRNEEVTIYSPCFKTKNFVWIYDLSKFVYRLIQSDFWKYDVVNLACIDSVTIQAIVEEMKHILNSKSKIVVAKNTRLPFCLNNSRAVEMGYESLSPKEIVHEYVKYMNNNVI